jgi:ketosteroid isomerase-like protein
VNGITLDGVRNGTGALGVPPPDVLRRHVEILKRGAAAIGQGDVGTMMSLITDDFELHPAIAGAFVGPTTYRGKEGARQYLLDIQEVFEEFQFIPLGFGTWRDYLVCPSRATGHGTASGVEIDLEMTAIWRVTNGQIVWGATFFTLAEGLEAIGARADELQPVE